MTQFSRICMPVYEIQKMHVQSLVCEDPLEKEMATHSSILACEVSWTEEPERLQSMGSQRVRHTKQAHTTDRISWIGKGVHCTWALLALSLLKVQSLEIYTVYFHSYLYLYWKTSISYLIYLIPTQRIHSSSLSTYL